MALAEGGVRRGAFGADPIPLNPLRALVSPYTWLATTCLLASLPIGVAGFVSMVVLLSVGVGLLPLALAGAPVIGLGIALAWMFGAAERWWLRQTLGLRIEAPPLPRRTGPWWKDAWRFVPYLATWRQVGYQVVALPLGVLSFVGAVFAWAVPISLIALPAYNWRLDQGADLYVLRVVNPVQEVFFCLLGVVLLGLTPLVIRGLAVTEAAVARALLGRFSAGQLTERVGALEVSRRRVVDSAEAERRRIERDLHDGAQQRLVALAMTLGRAKSRYRQDPASIGDLLDEAHDEAKQAIEELRSLTRGLHPPVLTDRGLDAALSALAARSPVPVTVDVQVEPRPTQTIEAIAYFVVAEALTNVAKHAGARTASVSVRRHEETLRVLVLDDGSGGADPAGGTGLAGLADRVSGVDGRLTVDSPLGGPTVLTVELPCVS